MIRQAVIMSQQLTFVNLLMFDAYEPCLWVAASPQSGVHTWPDFTKNGYRHAWRGSIDINENLLAPMLYKLIARFSTKN